MVQEALYKTKCGLQLAELKSRGKKTHSLVALGTLIVIMNHFHPLPEWFIGDLKPEAWLRDIYTLLFASTIREALPKR